MRELAPVVLFVYNRPWHTRQTLEALQNNTLADQSVLYIYADGPKADADEETLKKMAETRAVIRGKHWCKQVHIIESDSNKGLADSIVGGVTDIVNKYGKVIVLEDDIITSKGFLQYMNDALQVYEHEEKVMHISGYMFPIGIELPETFFYNATSCWGWGTWKRAWAHFNSNASLLAGQIEQAGLIDSFNIDGAYNFYSHLQANAQGTMKTWAVKWNASVFINNGLCLHPGRSLANNIGHDNSGENCSVTNRYSWAALAEYIQVKPINTHTEYSTVRQAMKEFNRPAAQITGKKNKYSSAKKVTAVQRLKMGIWRILPQKVQHKIKPAKPSEKDKIAGIYQKYKEFSMIPQDTFINNLVLCSKFKNIQGCVVECGVWRGGMSAAMSEVLGNTRGYYLFDSFEGLPQAKEIDGKAAIAWQNDKNSPIYFDNCKAEMAFAEKAMQKSGAVHYKLIKGWFSDTLPGFQPGQPIAVLRLDGDWYDSTMDCLNHLFDKVIPGGLIIIDDYHVWDGCSRAVHDFLSKQNRAERICQSNGGICYLIKKEG